MDDTLMGKMQEMLSDPESMQQLSELAQMLRSEPETAPASPAPAVPGMADGLDPGMLLKIGELFKNSGEPDKNAALLLALRPHLREKRQQRVDKALRLVKLWNMWQVMQKSGMLRDLL